MALEEAIGLLYGGQILSPIKTYGKQQAKKIQI
jgi:hypothetical protein